ncbi:putative peptidase tripeptidyl-peptidase protein [Eutypa lata UCREL1]|uniref:Putative peptidase tripeptidyl-peptidase protein n=1 Tax=Eutypa lata (strain UCR-EL1) TaxID=1287681 RepID=M7TMC9_EUTLA|nr:putative peptidase tripeptidyl-peptidase protein [Eutypa lata UCREL1]
MVCAQWQIEPRERYEGSFDGVQTRNPVLFVGNTYDAHTPLVSARNVSAGFAGSVVLEVNGYGHSSLAAPSLCTIQRTSAYWLHGTLPEPGTVCEVDAPLYSNVTWGDVIQAAAGNSTSAPSLARRDVQYIPNVGRIFGQGRVW